MKIGLLCHEYRGSFVMNIGLFCHEYSVASQLLKSVFKQTYRAFLS